MGRGALLVVDHLKMSLVRSIKSRKRSKNGRFSSGVIPLTLIGISCFSLHLIDIFVYHIIKYYHLFVDIHVTVVTVVVV